MIMAQESMKNLKGDAESFLEDLKKNGISSEPYDTRLEDIKESCLASAKSLKEYFDSEENMETELKKAGVPKLFLRAKAEDISKKTWEKVERWIVGDSYFMSGPTGCGKTHLAVAMMRGYILGNPPKVVDDLTHGYRVEKQLPQKFVSAPKILMEIRASYDKDSGSQEQEVIEEYARIHPILIIDDLGVEKVSDWVLQVFYMIIDARYSGMKQTLITSNLSLQELGDKLGDRIASRIAGMCNLIDLKGRDRRL